MDCAEGSSQDLSPALQTQAENIHESTQSQCTTCQSQLVKHVLTKPVNRRARRNKSASLINLQSKLKHLELNNDVVQLNIGGCTFQTTVTTLCTYEDSMLGRMFSHEWRKGDSNEVFIDRDGRHFHAILNFLRDGVNIVLPENETTLKEILVESEYYQLNGLTQLIKNKLHLPCRPIKVGEVVTWKPEAIPMYWRAFANSMNQDGVEYLFYYDKVGKKYNDKQTIATCIGCLARFTVDQITVFEYKIEPDQWEGVKQLMKHMRGLVVELVGSQSTCSIVMWANGKRLHVPNVAIIPADP